MAADGSLSGGSDIDLFVSLISTCNGTMKELYEKFYDYLTAKNWQVKRQNVSLGIKIGNIAVDLVLCENSAEAGSRPVRKVGRGWIPEVRRIDPVKPEALPPELRPNLRAISRARAS